MFAAVTGFNLEVALAGNGGVGLRPPSLFAPSISGFDSGASGCSIAWFVVVVGGGGAEFCRGGFELFSLAAAVTDVVMTVAPMPSRRASTLQKRCVWASQKLDTEEEAEGDEETEFSCKR